jgi:fused signal recognition particle receptor
MSSWFQKIGLGLKKSSAKLSEGLTSLIGKKALDAETLTELEEILLTADMGVKASQELIKRIEKAPRPSELTEDGLKHLLADEIAAVLAPCQKEFLPVGHKPFVILMIGVNGAGKTTTIGKMAAKLRQTGKQVSCIAADTFRAAAVDQLRIWGEKTQTRVFSGPQGCDSAGLCYDGLNAAVKAGDDVVFIDTAGRLQNKNDLMSELQKVVRVIKKLLPDAPHATLLTLDASTGQNAVSQVAGFGQICPLDGLIVTKLDGSAKGGILVAVAAEYTLPVYFIGVGEKTEDLDTFDAKAYARGLVGLSSDTASSPNR